MIEEVKKTATATVLFLLLQGHKVVLIDLHLTLLITKPVPQHPMFLKKKKSQK